MMSQLRHSNGLCTSSLLCTNSNYQHHLLVLLPYQKKNLSDSAKLQLVKYISDEKISRWAKHSGPICLHSSVRSTERNSSQHFCTAQQSAFLHWSRPAGALLCRNPIRTFHICGPRGWMGLPSQASHLWEAFLCGRGRLSKPLPCLDASCNGYFTEGLGCLSFFATVQACLQPQLLKTSKTRCKTYYISWAFCF